MAAEKNWLAFLRGWGAGEPLPPPLCVCLGGRGNSPAFRSIQEVSKRRWPPWLRLFFRALPPSSSHYSISNRLTPSPESAARSARTELEFHLKQFFECRWRHSSNNSLLYLRVWNCNITTIETSSTSNLGFRVFRVATWIGEKTQSPKNLSRFFDNLYRFNEWLPNQSNYKKS